jgi:hypothetical protein
VICRYNTSTVSEHILKPNLRIINTPKKHNKYVKNHIDRFYLQQSMSAIINNDKLSRKRRHKNKQTDFQQVNHLINY